MKDSISMGHKIDDAASKGDDKDAPLELAERTERRQVERRTEEERRDPRSSGMKNPERRSLLDRRAGTRRASDKGMGEK